MFKKQKDATFKTVVEGIDLATMVYGDKTLLAKFRLEKGVTLPLHQHPHEQTGVLVSGRIIITIGDVAHEAGPGDTWCIGPDVEHGAEALEDSVAVEVFSPVREDYLP